MELTDFFEALFSDLKLPYTIAKISKDFYHVYKPDKQTVMYINIMSDSEIEYRLVGFGGWTGARLWSPTEYEFLKADLKIEWLTRRDHNCSHAKAISRLCRAFGVIGIMVAKIIYHHYLNGDDAFNCELSFCPHCRGKPKRCEHCYQRLDPCTSCQKKKL